MRSMLKHFETLEYDEVVQIDKLVFNSDIGSPELNQLCKYINYKIKCSAEVRVSIGAVKFKDAVVQKIFEQLIYYACLNTAEKIIIDITKYWNGNDELAINFSALYIFKYIKQIDDSYIIIIDQDKREKFITIMEKPMDYNVSELDIVTRIRMRLDTVESISKVLADKLVTLQKILDKELRMQQKEELIDDINNLVSESYTNARDHAGTSLYVDIDIIKAENYDFISYVAYNCSEKMIYSPIKSLIFSDYNEEQYKNVIQEIKHEVFKRDDLLNDNRQLDKFLFGKVCEASVTTRIERADEDDSGIGIPGIAKRINSYSTLKYREKENYFMSGQDIMTTNFDFKGESSFHFPGTLIHGNLIIKI